MSEMPVQPVITPSGSEEKIGESSSEGLIPPAHEEKVEIESPEDDNDSIIPVPLTKQNIEVIAERKGFYGQQRIAKGQTFSVSSFDALGEWMICVDPELEKKRIQFFIDKKVKAKAKAKK